MSTAAEHEADFQEFVTTRWPALLRTAYLLTGDHGHAEDLVQTALVRMHRYWRKIQRDGGSPEAYTRKILVNLNTDRWRRGWHREQPHAEITDATTGRTAADAYASTDTRDELWRAVLALPPRMRAVLVLRYFEDMTEAEVADVLCCSAGTLNARFCTPYRYQPVCCWPVRAAPELGLWGGGLLGPCCVSIHLGSFGSSLVTGGGEAPSGVCPVNSRRNSA